MMAIPNSTPNASDYITCITNYETILKEYNLLYKPSEFYWQVGDIRLKQGWVLHISVVRPQIPLLLHQLLPIILPSNAPFKIVRDSQIAGSILDGGLGTNYQCKILAIYPDSNDRATFLAKEIIAATGNFKGPSIPTDRLIEGIVYAQFVNLSPLKSGKKVKQNKEGNLSQDITEWPFHKLQCETVVNQKRLLNFKYYAVSTIKQDVKGDVIKALYFKKPWIVCSCVIKQGRKYMLFDDAGRDIQERLIWQYDLHRQLTDYISIPKAIDFFKENGDVYLVLEYIRGTSISSLIQKLYIKNNWNSISNKDQILLTKHLLGISKMIHRLHEKGLVHRDVTPENFIVDKARRIWLLDVELMWSLDSKKYSAPFQTGTLGFTSPEQQADNTPTTKEDIYALGASMLAAFTNLHPIKFGRSSSVKLKETLSFLIENNRLANLIGNCLSKYPLDRPSSKMLIIELELFLKELQQKQPTNPQHSKPMAHNIQDGKLRETIQIAIQGLSHPNILSSRCWISKLETSQDKLRNPQVGSIISSGWNYGVAGPLWLLANARKNGFNIETCLEPYIASWKYLTEKHAFSSADGSLYTGTAGTALTLSAAFDSNLLSPSNTELRIEKFFEKITFGPTLANGISGQGIALLSSKHWMNPEQVEQILQSYIRILLDSQRSDGSWHIASDENHRKTAQFTLANGVPGIIWFLLNYFEVYPDNNVLKTAIKACRWLIKSTYNKSKGKWAWLIMNNSIPSTNFSTNSGVPGLILVLIKAFKVTGDSQYRDIASSSLISLPARPHFTNFTLGEGLAGIGEVYLEAYKTFNDPIWLERAAWISQLFILSLQSRTLFDGYWVMEGDSPVTADLFTGNGGTIHFLMRYLLPDKVNHPLAPYLTTQPTTIL